MSDQLPCASVKETTLQYEPGLLQGQSEIKYPTRGKTKIVEITRQMLEVHGSKISITEYIQNQYRNEEIWQQHTQDFELERSGRISLITWRNFEVTKGMAKG